MKRILVARFPNFKLEASLAWLDRLANGLISQATFKGYFEKNEEDLNLFSFLPRYSDVDAILLWTRPRKEFPWNQVLEMYPQGSLQVFYCGEFSDKELERVRSYFDHFKKWSPPQPEGELPAHGI